uniref:Uncharacterized protein n=1 Tax=Poecilia reticulata TaxID=8081 RepID=A0A3P9PGU4_POERE
MYEKLYQKLLWFMQLKFHGFTYSKSPFSPRPRKMSTVVILSFILVALIVLATALASDGSGTDGEDEQEEDSVDHSGSTKENEGDDSDAEGSEAGEEDRLIDNKPEENEEVGGNSEEKQELKVEGKAEASGGTGLLIDLKQFSGSAIWSEQKEVESQGGDVTAL